MRVLVTGATGNVGTAVVRALLADPAVSSVVGVARRLPDPGGAPELSALEWRSADVATSDLGPVMAGADAVVHLAWLLQPSRRRPTMDATNVDGTQRVIDAAAAAGVARVVVASSVGAYSPGPKDARVDETWPTGGIHTSSYSQEKAAVERLLDRWEEAHPDTAVVRLRPGLVLQREAAQQIARLFLGPFVPTVALRPRLLKLLPDISRLRLQVVHSDDAADAYRRAVLSDARGAYNVASEPVLDAQTVASAWGGRTFAFPAGVARAVADLTWHLHLQPTEAGWLDLGRQTPLMDTSKIRAELGWEPRRNGLAAIDDLLDGFARRVGGPTPPLVAGRRFGVTVDPAPGGPAGTPRQVSRRGS